MPIRGTSLPVRDNFRVVTFTGKLIRICRPEAVSLELAQKKNGLPQVWQAVHSPVLLGDRISG
tara:strand:+ start:11 stop:199 length:189 start_codon:yes stop_codon:yes gene_type:complete